MGIIGKVGIGKTKQLVQEASDCCGVIVCANVEKMREKAICYQCPLVEIISYDEFFSKKTLCDDNKKYFIHKIEKLLEKLHVENFTLTT